MGDRTFKESKANPRSLYNIKIESISHRIRDDKMPNGKLISLANSHVVMIHQSNGEMKPLYTLNNVDFRFAKEIILIDDILYIHFGGSRFFEINLPYHEIAL